MKEFFVEELKDIYFAEHEVLKGLKKMEPVATSPTLKESIQKHYQETENQIKRLEEVFGMVECSSMPRHIYKNEVLCKNKEIKRNFDLNKNREDPGKSKI